MKEYNTFEKLPSARIINERINSKYKINELEVSNITQRKYKKAKNYFLSLNQQSNHMKESHYTNSAQVSIDNGYKKNNNHIKSSSKSIKLQNLHYETSHRNLRLNSETYNAIIPPLITTSHHRQLSQIYPQEQKNKGLSPFIKVNNKNIKRLTLKLFSPYPHIAQNPENQSSSNAFFYKYNSNMMKALNSNNNRLGIKSTENSTEKYYEMIVDENEKLKKSLECSKNLDFLKKHNLPKLIPEKKRVIEINDWGSHFFGSKYNPSNYEIPPRNRTKRHAYGYLFNY